MRWAKRAGRTASLMAAAAALILTPGCSGAAPAAPPPPSRLVERSFFGLHVQWLNQDVRLTLPPVGSIRLWDTRTTWKDVEPRDGDWNFRRLDNFMDLAKRLDAEVLLTFGGIPQWAALRPNVPGPYGPGSGSTPRSMEDWDDFVRTLTQRYRGQIKFYELINEPTNPKPDDDCRQRHAFYCATPRELADLGHRTRAIIRTTDPGAIMNSPGFVHPHIVQAYLQAGGPGAAYDAHVYPKPETRRQAERWAQFRQALAAGGKPNAALWSTEGGLPVNGEGLEGETYIPEREQAGAVARYLIFAAASNIGRVFYYTWEHQQYGLSTGMGTEPNEGGRGYLRTMTWLLGARISPCVAQDNVWRCSVTRGATGGTIVWYDAPGERSIDLPEGGKAARFVHRMDGSVKPLGGGLLKIGKEPVLVTFGTPKWGVEQKFIKL